MTRDLIKIKPVKRRGKSCAPGKFQPSAGQGSCKDCPKGYEQTESGSTSCDECTIGYYSAELGRSRCRSCGLGRGGDYVLGPTPRVSFEYACDMFDSCSPDSNGNYMGLIACDRRVEGQYRTYMSYQLEAYLGDHFRRCCWMGDDYTCNFWANVAYGDTANHFEQIDAPNGWRICKPKKQGVFEYSFL